MQNNGQFYTPPVVKNLLIINLLFFMAESFLPAGVGNRIVEIFGLFYWESPFFRPWQVVTHMFLHGSWSHLFTNMFALWMFGRIMEQSLGSKRFLIYYFVCGIGAALLQLGVNAIEIAAAKSDLATNPALAYSVRQMINTPTVGASGAIFGILLGFGMLYPNSSIMLLIPPIPMKAKYFVIIYGILELTLGISGRMDNIAHFAHVGGMLWGYLLLRWWKKRGDIYY